MEIFRVNELETKLGNDKYIKNFENKIAAQDGEQLVFYQGKAYNLHFKDDVSNTKGIDVYNIQGEIKITRYNRIINIEKKRKISLFPPKIEIEEIPKEDYKPVWAIKYDFARDLVKNGETSTEYRDRLKSIALNKRIKLSDKLLNALFDPLDKLLIEKHIEMKKQIK